MNETAERPSCGFRQRPHRFLVIVVALAVVGTLGAVFEVRLLVTQIWNGHTDTVQKCVSPPQGDGPWPRVAWLMSFPHSGTTFTLAVTRSLTDKLTAGNFRGRGGDGEEFFSVHANSTSGPFWQSDPLSGEYETPCMLEHVLTKTHCGGNCVSCPPTKYIGTSNRFLDFCRGDPRSKGLLPDYMLDADRQMEITREHFMYSSDIVKKAVHLIRNPFDNIVSRFRYQQRNNGAINGVNLTNATLEGFQTYCWALDHSKHEAMEQDVFTELLGKDVWNQLDRVPCRAEFFRYVQWHNLAFETTHKMLKIPTLVLHYERFGSHFNETASNLLEFLNLKRRHDHHTHFIGGKHYSEFYSPQEIEAARVAVKALATPITWENIQHYFLK